jgi:hypothetical protein
LTPPSFWPFPKPLSPERRPRAKEITAREEAEINRYLLDIPPKSVQVDDMVQRVIDKYNVARSKARVLVAGLPADRKLARGERIRL